MDISEELTQYGPLGVLVFLVIVFLKDRRDTTDRLISVIDDTRVLLVEVRELIKNFIRSSDTH